MDSFRSPPSKDTSLRIRLDQKRLWKRSLNGKCLNKAPEIEDGQSRDLFPAHTGSSKNVRCVRNSKKRRKRSAVYMRLLKFRKGLTHSLPAARGEGEKRTRREGERRKSR